MTADTEPTPLRRPSGPAWGEPGERQSVEAIIAQLERLNKEQLRLAFAMQVTLNDLTRRLAKKKGNADGSP